MTSDEIDVGITMPGNMQSELLANRYRIVRQLGQGGMGSVWLAEDIQLDNKQFAIKMLPSILVSNKRAYAQLKSEALVAMKLTHPNIVTLRAFEENGGNPFLVMDYIDGETLDDYLADVGNGEWGTGNGGEGTGKREQGTGNGVRDGVSLGCSDGVSPSRNGGDAIATSHVGTSKEPQGCSGGVPPSRIGKKLAIIALLAALAGGAYYGWRKYDEGVKASLEEARLISEKRIAEEKRANEERIARLKADKERAEAERQRIADEREKRVKELAEQLKKLEQERKPTPNISGEPADAVLSLAEQEARQKEVARLAELRVDIGIKIDDAKEKMAKVAAYRGEPDGFTAHIDNADAKWRTASGVERKPATVAEAEAAFRAVSEAEGAIARELNWLKTNKAARDEAKAIEATMASDMDPEIERYKASDYAGVMYGEGMKLRREGNAALASGEFTSAKAKLEAAKSKLSGAVAVARKFCIDTHVRLAKKYLDASRWQECVGECDTVLGWDASSAEAKRLKAEAEGHLVPSARVVATIDGREVAGARLSDGKKDHLTPINWTLKDGTKYGPYEVSYESGGRRYLGTFEAVTVDWRGPRAFTVALREYTVPKHGDVKTLTLPGGATMEMIYVGPGTFTMGSPPSEDGHGNDEIQHRVTLTKGFWLGKCEVTQKQWQSVMGSNPSYFKGDSNPVENVSWNDCQEFVQKVNDAARRQFGGGARLPTEAEWEYACRAGTTTAYFWGNALNGARANCNGNYPCGTTAKGPYRERAVAVGSYQPNAWGFCDMHGNVWEWCQDWYGDYPVNSVTDPQGSASGDYRVLRGGCWNYDARNCRSAIRIGYYPGSRNNGFGFRLCCSAGLREGGAER